MSVWNTSIHQFVDGVDAFNAVTINPVINSLATRDQYLFEQLNNAAIESMLVMTDQPMSNAIVVSGNGTPVYFNTGGGTPILNPALATFTSNISPTNDGHLSPAQSSFVFGIVKQIYEGGGEDGIYYGDVYVQGLVNDPTINYYNLLDTYSQSNVSSLSAGPLYLSSIQAGKLTIYPSGCSIFVGYYLGGSSNSFILNPTTGDLNQLYFNYEVYLLPVAAGSVASLGWRTTAQAYSDLGITGPAGSVYYYNIPTLANLLSLYNATTISLEQTQQANLLKEALPANPICYTMLFLNGVLQTQYDSDHTSGTYLINTEGIWWMSSSTSPITSTPVVQLFITKLNPNYASTIVTSLTSESPALSITDINGLPATNGDLEISLNLDVNLTTSTPGAGTAVQTLSYDPGSGSLIGNTEPVINSLSVGPGLSYSINAGQATLSLSNFSLSGEVTDIEPQEADFVYKGLHSYLRMKKPTIANQQAGLIGKLLIPASIPANTNLWFTLIGFTETGSPASGTTPYISFEFDYSTSNTGSSISTATTNSQVYVSASTFPLTQASVYQGYIGAPTGGNPLVTCFTVPYSAFSANSYVNFRIARTYDTTYGTYANPIGIIGVLWAIM